MTPSLLAQPAREEGPDQLDVAAREGPGGAARADSVARAVNEVVSWWRADRPLRREDPGAPGASAGLGAREPGSARREPDPAPARWGLAELSGRVIELSASGVHGANLTFATGLVREVQERGELVAWITGPFSIFFPPDVAAGGVALEDLAVVRVPCLDSETVTRAADPLLRSGGFGLIVVDLDGATAELPLAHQSRLAGLAQRHGTTLALLTRKPDDAPSLGSLVSLHAQTRRTLLGDGRARCELVVRKDKRGGPGWGHEELCRVTPGLR